MARLYDVIVIGARCAGSPTAMLLARLGCRVLLLDRATFPSDTISSHLVQPAGVAALSRWGLLDRLVATGCPPLHTYRFDFGSFTIAGAPGKADFPLAYCARRTVLDKLLVDAAAEAGAEVREAFSVEHLLIEDGRVTGITGRSGEGVTVTERAGMVVGADGRHSLVAREVRPPQYKDRPPFLAGYYSYWSGLPLDGRVEFGSRPRRGFAAAPTHGGLTMVIVVWPQSEFAANKSDIEGGFLRAIDLVPEFAERMRGARREAPFAGTGVPNFVRKPYGPGWALVGDAAYNKDFITAQGIGDAFISAEWCASAIDAALTGARPFDEAMWDYQRARDDRLLPMYELTCELAALEELSPDAQLLLAAVAGDREASDAFAQVNAGTISPAEFFAPGNIQAIMARAAGPA